METVRIITCSFENGDNETITFTEDFDIDAEDYCKPGQIVVIDKKIGMEVPLGFPLDHTFER